MTPPASITGNLSATRVLGQRWPRRMLLGILTVILAVLTVIPREYRATVLLTPSDPSALGLGGALGQLGALTNVFGSQAAVEISLKVARGIEVRRQVINRLGLVRSGRFANEAEAQRWLRDEIEVLGLRGGILQISVQLRDPDFALQLVNVVSDATRERLAQISQAQTSYKRRVLEKLVGDSRVRYNRAQVAYDDFRRRTRYSDPGTSIAAIGERVPAIQAAIKARQVDLNAARQFGTDQSFTVQQIKAEIASLQQQLREAESLNTSNPNSISRVVSQSTEADRLDRELYIARGLYLSYQRYLEGTSVEDLASGANVRVLEPAYIDPGMQIHVVPLGLLLVLLVGWGAIELYQMRPPVGADPRYLRSM